MGNLSLPQSKNVLPFALPLVVFACSALIVVSGAFWKNPELLSFAITYDLALFSPLLYLFLIRRKKIPKTTAVPLFIGGLLFATFLIPDAYHFHLDLLWNYAFPLIELSVISFVIYQAVQITRAYKKEGGTSDFLTVFRNSAEKVLGNQRIASVLATEFGVFYYSFFSWRKSKSLPALQFSYHKETGAPAVYGVFIFLILIETIAIHFIVAIWSPAIAWVLTILSLYTCIQLLGLLKAMQQRPITLDNERIFIRCGLVGDGEVLFDNIESVRLVQEVPEEKGVYHLSLLKSMEPYNLEIKLKEPISLIGLYGMRKECHTLLLSIDEKLTFKNKIEEMLNK